MTLARLFVFVGGLVVLLLFAALIGPYFIDWTSYRDDFEREASRILGQKVEVLGEAEARLLPFPSVTFHDVRVENAETGQPMMTVARFSMDAELAPFLRGQILIYDMRIERPKATVRLGADGTLDWAARTDGALQSSSIVLENVDITNGAVDIIDGQNDRTHHVTGLNAELSAASLTGPWRIEGTGALDGQSGAFSFNSGAADDDGSVRLRSRLLPDSEPVSIELEGSARFEDKKPSYAGQFTLQVLDLAAISDQGGQSAGRGDEAGDKPAVARGTGNFTLDTARLRVDEYRLEVGPSDDPYVVSGEATIDTGKTPEFLLTASGQQIDLDRLNAGSQAGATTENEAGNAAAPPPSPAERLAVLRRIAGLIPVPPMAGQADIRLPALVAGDTTVRDITIRAEPDGQGWTIDRFAAKFPGRTQVEATGRLRTGEDFGFSGNLVVAAKQPSGLAEWLTGTVDPQIRLIDAAGFSADVTLQESVQRFNNLELAIGPSTARGRFERSTNGDDRPQVALDLTGDDIDLDAVEALAGLFGGESSGVSLAGADISARLKAGRFSGFGTRAGGVDALIGYRDGVLDVKRLKVDDLEGGAISATGRVSGLSGRSDHPRGTMRMSVDAGIPKGLVDLAADTLGDTALLSYLSGNAGVFSDAHLTVKAAIGEDGPPGSLALEAKGTAGGSDVTVKLNRGKAFSTGMDVPTVLEVTLENDSVNRLFSQIGMQPLPIDAPGPALLSMRLDGVPTEGAQVAMTLSTADSDLSANGTLSVSGGGAISGSIDTRLKSGDLGPYLIMNAIALPVSADGMPADIAATVKPREDGLDLAGVSGTVSGNRIKGDLAVSTADGMTVSGALSLGEIDAGWLADLVLGQGTFGGAVAGDGPVAFSREDFAPPQDFGTDFDLTVDAAQAHLGFGEPAHDMSARVAFSNGTFDFSDVEASWLGGDLAGRFRLANSNGSGLVTSQFTLSGAELSRAVWRTGTTPLATGAMTLSTSFEGSGKSALALANSLTGSGVLKVDGLTVDGLRTSGFKRILAAADQENFEIADDSVRRLARSVIDGGQFAAGDVSLPFTIAGGTLRTGTVRFSDETGSVSGDARANLAEGTVDGTFSLEFAPGDERITGATPAVGLTFSGPIASPERTLDVGELGNYLSLRAFEIQRRKVEFLQAGVLEKQRLRRVLERQKAEAAARALDRALKNEETRLRRLARQAHERAAERAKATEHAAEEAARAQDETAGDGPSGTTAGPPPDDSASAPETPSDTPDLSFDELPGVESPNLDN